MAEREFSCIKQVVKTVQIPLPATFISNEISGIAEILDSWKRQYSKQLQGVVVNYKHLSLSSPNGFIAPNKPFVYYSVKATFDLFCPKVGDIVKGKINHISMKHILCLIEDTISVAIHLSSNSPKEIAPFICLNREILFEISSFSFDKKMALSVTAKITRKCIQLMNELFPPPTFGNLVDTPELSNNTDEGIGTSSESADDGLLNHTFDGSKVNDDDVNFKKPFSTDTKSKKKSSKRTKSNSESSMDTSDVSTSDEKPKKKKKKHKDKSNPDAENDSSANNLTSDMVSSDMLIQNFSSFNHSEILDAIKEEETLHESNTRVKKHKKKRKRDSSPSLIGEPSKSDNQTLSGDMSSLDLNTSAVFETAKSSKKRKRESESSFMDTSEQSTADEMPKKKKKRKDKTAPSEKKEVKNELSDIPDAETVAATLLSMKKEKSSPVKISNSLVPENKVKKKNKDKKSKEKDKSKKKKGKILASGAVLKKDKKSQKKGSKKNKLDGEHSKKHKKSSKSHKKDKSDKKKKKDSSINKISDVIKSEVD